PLLIHCWAGISRSTAGAFVVLCALNPHADEHSLARALRRASPTAYPNRRIVALADIVLGRNGRMSAAVDHIGRGLLAEEGKVFSLPARHAA
ncbi:MAG: tyrosine protein phosphatase, partial [Methyloceanibacter sp.]